MCGLFLFISVRMSSGFELQILTDASVKYHLCTVHMTRTIRNFCTFTHKRKYVTFSSWTQYVKISLRMSTAESEEISEIMKTTNSHEIFFPIFIVY